MLKFCSKVKKVLRSAGNVKFFLLAENVQSLRLNLLVYIFYSFFCFFVIFIYLFIYLFLSDHAMILIYSKDAFYLFLLYNKEAFLTRCVSTIYIL